MGSRGSRGSGGGGRASMLLKKAAERMGGGLSVTTSGEQLPPLTAGKPNKCFENAWMEYNAQVAAGEKPTYMMGLATSRRPDGGVSAVSHAWVSVRGKVVESTPLRTPVEKYVGKSVAPAFLRDLSTVRLLSIDPRLGKRFDFIRDLQVSGLDKI